MMDGVTGPGAPHDDLGPRDTFFRHLLCPYGPTLARGVVCRGCEGMFTFVLRKMLGG